MEQNWKWNDSKMNTRDLKKYQDILNFNHY